MCSFCLGVQAWAFACAVRQLLGKAPTMWMDSFPHDVWIMHRRLHHRYLRYHKCFDKATVNLPSFTAAEGEPAVAAARQKGKQQKTTVIPKPNAMCLLVDSESAHESGEEEESSHESGDEEVPAHESGEEEEPAHESGEEGESAHESGGEEESAHESGEGEESAHESGEEEESAHESGEEESAHESGADEETIQESDTDLAPEKGCFEHSSESSYDPSGEDEDSTEEKGEN